MSTVHVELNDDLMTFVANQAAQGGATPGQYVSGLIADEQKRTAMRDLEAKLLEGLQGPAVEMTAEDWDSIRGAFA